MNKCSKIMLMVFVCLIACVTISSASNIKVESIPTGAEIFMKLSSDSVFVDTGEITDHTFGGIDLGNYDVYITKSGYFTPEIQTKNVGSGTTTFSFNLVEASSSIAIVKKTNGDDANSVPGPSITVGGIVDWTYDVTNTGNVALTSVTVTDDQGVTVTCPKTTLAPGEMMQCTASGTAVAGQYVNVGTAYGTYETTQISANDPSHYFGTDLTPVPEFPTMALPAALIIGLVGSILFIQRTKENE